MINGGGPQVTELWEMFGDLSSFVFVDCDVVHTRVLPVYSLMSLYYILLLTLYSTNFKISFPVNEYL